MSTFYNSLSTLAVKMIAKYGRTMTLRSYTTSGKAYDPTRTKSDTAVKGVQSKFTVADQNLFAIKDGDKLFLLDGKVEPTAGMQIIDGSTYEVVMVDQIKPGEIALAYRVQARS